MVDYIAMHRKDEGYDTQDMVRIYSGADADLEDHCWLETRAMMREDAEELGVSRRTIARDFRQHRERLVIGALSVKKSSRERKPQPAKQRHTASTSTPSKPADESWGTVGLIALFGASVITGTVIYAAFFGGK